MASKARAIGTKIGQRTLLALMGINEHGRRSWKTQCACGAIVCCTTEQAKRSLRCIKCGHKGPRPWRKKRPFEVTYNALRQRGRHPVLISYEQFIEFTKIQECHYCGTPVLWEPYRKPGLTTASNLDRKDNDQPYVMNNIVVCCLRCNKAKNTHFSYDEWKQLGAIVRSWRALALLQKELENQ